MATFVGAAKEQGICVEYSEAFFRTDPSENIVRIAGIIKTSSSKVIVAFVSYSDMEVLLKELSLQNVTGLQWIGSESWISDSNIATGEWQHILRGSLGFAIPKAKIGGLKEFLLSIHPSAGIPIYNKLWETMFGCLLHIPENKEDDNVCSGTERLSDLQNQYTDVSELQIANNVYKAVYAVAHALHNMYACRNNQLNDTCKEGAGDTEPWRVSL